MQLWDETKVVVKNEKLAERERQSEIMHVDADELDETMHVDADELEGTKENVVRDGDETKVVVKNVKVVIVEIIEHIIEHENVIVEIVEHKLIDLVEHVVINSVLIDVHTNIVDVDEKIDIDDEIVQLNYNDKDELKRNDKLNNELNIELVVCELIIDYIYVDDYVIVYDSAYENWTPF